ncbi:Etoposide-induced protein 2.4 [Daphnia magna]|uniref:Etoposide-induced protein 2.4 n=1 Tax=Daphnia magna TaxID=35525 RepID=A0A162CQR7_9CRUS|nr:Etoposide-induced protein 2.4 [Daphnia magna]
MSRVKDVLSAASRGILDSLRGFFLIFTLDREIELQRSLKRETKSKIIRRAQMTTPSTSKEKQEEPRILHRTLQCSLLNGGVFCLSIFAFNGIILPLIEALLTFSFSFGGQLNAAQWVWSWTSPVLSATFSTLWILPLFVLSKFVNCFWFQDIADAAYKYSRGRPQLLPSISKMIADMLFSMVIQALFLVQAMVMGLLPIAVFNGLLSMLHMCLLYSLYSFEYRWFNEGWELPKRLTHIENHWPYFFGFGLPLAILTSIPSSTLVSGNEARPTTKANNYPLRLFSPVVALANTIFNRTIGRSRST